MSMPYYCRNLLKQLSAVERYALNLMEWSEREWRAEQLRLLDAELEAAKTEIDATDKLEEMAEVLRNNEQDLTPLHKQSDSSKKVNQNDPTLRTVI